MTTPTPPDPAPDVRVIAYYRLPDGPRPPGATAGEELPEWARVRAGRPEFIGHEQPQLPGELGYCDVREAAVRDAQAVLAREYCISAFCYVFRGSDMPGVLDPTLADILATGRPDFPFCVCWESTRLRYGAGFGPGDPTHERVFTPDESSAVVEALVPVFRDHRYLRVGGRPLFVVSSPDPIDAVQAATQRWREVCARAGVGEIHLARWGAPVGENPEQLGFDSVIEGPPLGAFARSARERLIGLTPESVADARSYRSYVAQLLVAPHPDYALFRCVMPGWDDTVRDLEAHTVFVDGNPETFGFWTERALDQTRLRFSGDARLLFVRAWNEWDAACHLEPDGRHGRRYLEALRDAVSRPPQAMPERPSLGAMRAWLSSEGAAAARFVRSNPRESGRGDGPQISVVMPAYNHERYVVAALDSVVAQSHRSVEIIVVDDGSRDATGALLDDYTARCRTHELTVVHQRNAGAHEAINHGLSLARGEIVALMNSDDLYAPERLARMVAEMERRGAGFAFSVTRFIDDEGKDVDPNDPYVKDLRKATAEARNAPDPVYVLVHNNITISTGNFVFRRALLERTGGFCAMRVCHDWDFVLAASYVAPIVMVDEPLYLYRLHGTNTFADSRVLAAFELEQLLCRFFARITEHPQLQDPERAARFLDHLRRVRLAGYLR